MAGKKAKKSVSKAIGTKAVAGHIAKQSKKPKKVSKKSPPAAKKRPDIVAPKKRAKPQQTVVPETVAIQETTVHTAQENALSPRLLRMLRYASLLGGASIVALWTVIRHITNGVNFDVVGQIGLAEQWIQGMMTGAQLGATNYILKIPFYFMVNHLHGVSPMHRLLLLALVFNVATFVGLFILFEKLLTLYGVVRRTWLYVAMAWLATIAGNVFWVDYANSRNLEVVGGVLFVYVALKYYEKRFILLAPLLAIIGSFVFFADMLELYVCGAGVCLFLLARLIFRRSRWAANGAAVVIAATVAGYLGAQGLFWLSRRYLHVVFYNAPTTHVALAPTYGLHIIQGLVVNTLKIFGADFVKPPYGIATIREVLNAFVLAALVALLVRLIVKGRRQAAPRLLLSLIVVNYAVYIASGQVLQWETQRYLLLVPMFGLAAVAVSGDRLNGTRARRLQYAWLAVILVSATMLVGALAVSWPQRHSKDAHIGSLISYAQQHRYRYALSSREVGITTTYFAQGSLTALPLGCGSDHTLYPTNLFYDNAVFKGLYEYSGEVPVILQDNAITFGKVVCSHDDIVTQLGVPKREEQIPGVGSALIYDAASVHLSGIDRIVGHPRPETALSTATIAAAATLQKLSDCPHGVTDVVVAHTDDDILFMNPDLSGLLATEGCVRTIYVTAADDGRAPAYWENRERGIQAAYAAMLGLDNTWETRESVIDGHPITTRTVVGYGRVQLVFLRLPDGNVSGKGFERTGHLSLKTLASNRYASIKTVDETTSYSRLALTRVLRTIMYIDQPSAVYTLNPGGELSVGDHNDHMQVARLALAAATMARVVAPISMYVGYPTNNLAANLTPEQADQKRAIFTTYAPDDETICSLGGGCALDGTYGNYFSRQYKTQKLPAPKPVHHSVQSHDPVGPAAADFLRTLLHK